MPTLQETHYGVITDNNDPEKRGRVKVRCQSLVGADHELPDWCEPAAGVMTSPNSGFLFLPVIGATVELIIDAHDTDFDEMPGERFLQNPAIKWRPGTYTEKNGVMPLPKDLATSYPNMRGWVTPAGHKLLFNDKGSILIVAKDGGSIELDTSGKIILSSPTLIGKGATELMILGNAFMTLYNAHTHPTGVGPSGPPAVQMTTAQLSQDGNKVK